MAATKKTGFELEQLIAKQIHDRAMKLPTVQARLRALGHVADAISQEQYNEMQEKVRAEMASRVGRVSAVSPPGQDELEARNVSMPKAWSTTANPAAPNLALFPNG